MNPDLSASFPRYTDFDPAVPIYCATPELDGCFHRFFDTSPISPSGRYLGLTRFLREDQMPRPGDPAEIVLVDLETGEARVVAETRGWDTQLGAQVQWGPTDEQLFFNDMTPGKWRPFCVVMDPLDGRRRELDGTVYMVSPDGRQVASPCLLRTGATQMGYGVIAPPEVVPRNEGAATDDGIFVTDVATGESRMLVSLREIFETAQPRMNPDDYVGGTFYGFHVKWNLQGTRLMFVMRYIPPGETAPRAHNLITMNADGSDIRVAIPPREGRPSPQLAAGRRAGDDELED